MAYDLTAGRDPRTAAALPGSQLPPSKLRARFDMPGLLEQVQA